MSFSSQTFRGRATLEPASAPKIYNVTSPGTPNTEFSIALSDNVKKLIVRARGNSDIKLCFTSGLSGTEFITIPGHSSYSEDGIALANATLYLQTTKPSEVVEILEWT